jgi:hypothetical protein
MMAEHTWYDTAMRIQGERDAAREELAQVKAERDRWQEEAKLTTRNAEYWRDQYFDAIKSWLNDLASLTSPRVRITITDQGSTFYIRTQDYTASQVNAMIAFCGEHRYGITVERIDGEGRS